jgi:hypothetical protein
MTNAEAPRASVAAGLVSAGPAAQRGPANRSGQAFCSKATGRSVRRGGRAGMRACGHAATGWWRTGADGGAGGTAGGVVGGGSAQARADGANERTSGAGGEADATSCWAPARRVDRSQSWRCPERSWRANWPRAHTLKRPVVVHWATTAWTSAGALGSPTWAPTHVWSSAPMAHKPTTRSTWAAVRARVRTGSRSQPCCPSQPPWASRELGHGYGSTAQPTGSTRPTRPHPG